MMDEKRSMKIIWSLAIITGIGVGLSGCAVSKERLAGDFGVAVRQDLVAQVADPDARYPRKPPASNGPRASLAQVRYQTGTSIPPIGNASRIGLDTGAPATPPPQGGPGAAADAGASGP
jgi:hypothetical protein